MCKRMCQLIVEIMLLDLWYNLLGVRGEGATK